VIVLDTGPLVALLDADDRHHERCRAWLADNQETLVVPVPVITETCYFIERDSGSQTEADFLASFDPGGVFERADLASEDWTRARDLVLTYADLPLGIVNAAVVAVAERFGIDQIATLDHRHFSVVRPAHAQRFTLLP
jgi:predicted nucleic acid-binding protein